MSTDRQSPSGESASNDSHASISPPALQEGSANTSGDADIIPMDRNCSDVLFDMNDLAAQLSRSISTALRNHRYNEEQATGNVVTRRQTTATEVRELMETMRALTDELERLCIHPLQEAHPLARR
ncbi:uncharacterized protein LOC129579340 isoform X2 [Sitodiplosis mosellana]|nr:uncharacterized protein LOC129579340 isoform X2 [Sitodiplosis mosellana]